MAERRAADGGAKQTKAGRDFGGRVGVMRCKVFEGGMNG